mgnify:CR=1 FL=1
MKIAREDIWQAYITVLPKRCVKNSMEKKEGGCFASSFSPVGVIRLERTTIPTQVGMR